MKAFRELTVWKKAHEMLSPHAYAALESQVKEVKRMLTSLIQRVRADVERQADETRRLTQVDKKKHRSPRELTADT